VTTAPVPVDVQLAIRDLLGRYAWALDTGDTEGYVRLFVPDVGTIVEHRPDGTRHARGAEEIRALVRRFHDDPAFPGRQHRFDNVVVAADAERSDRWLVRSYVLTTSSDPADTSGRPTLYWTGLCEDLVASIGGELLIEEHTIKYWRGDVLGRFQEPASS
jgi:hypothetical protein